MDGLAEHELLYRLIAEQFVRLGWKTVCLSVAPVPGHQSKSAVDPPEDILKRLGVAGVRAGSSCRNDGDEVVVLGSNVTNAVAVTLAGADREGDDYLVRVYWCCWAGWGTLRFRRNADGWAFKGTEGWVQT